MLHGGPGGSTADRGRPIGGRDAGLIPASTDFRSDVDVRVATFNVNGVNGRLPRLLDWLAETRPDVVCLQELKTDDAKFPHKALGQSGYRAVWHGQRAFHGVAILANGSMPAERRRGLPGARRAEAAWPRRACPPR